MLLRTMALAALLSATALTGAEAAVVNGTFTGTITSGVGVESGVDFSTGNAVAGTFSYDTAGLALVTGDNTWSYWSADTPATPFTLSLTVNGNTYTVALASQLSTLAGIFGWDVGAEEFGTYGDFGIAAHDYVAVLADPGAVWFSLANVADQAWVTFSDGAQALMSVSSLTVTTVPEPMSLVLLASGLAGGLALGRRRRAG